MKISTFMVTLLLVTGIMTGFFTFMGSLPKGTNFSNSDITNTTFDKFDELANETQNLQDDIFAAEPTEENVQFLVAKGLVKALRGAYNSVGIFTGMINDTAKETAAVIPSWVWATLISIMSLLFLFAIISTFGGKDA